MVFSFVLFMFSFVWFVCSPSNRLDSSTSTLGVFVILAELIRPMSEIISSPGNSCLLCECSICRIQNIGFNIVGCMLKYRVE